MPELLEDENGAPFPEDVQTAHHYAIADLVAEVTELRGRLDAGVTQAIAARGGGTSIVMALTGDPGAVVEADPFGRSADA